MRLALILLIPVALSATSLEQQFAHKYRMLHKAQDVQGALALVHWDRVTLKMKKQMTATLTKDFLFPLESVSVSRMASTQFESEDSDATQLKPNLKVKAVMIVNFKAKSKKAEARSTSYLLGKHRGRYRIAVPAPK